MIIPSDNSLLVWRIIDENNRTHCFVVSLKFEFHLMGIHISAFSNEELALDDFPGCQLRDASSVLSLIHSYITSPPKMKPPIMTIAITAEKPTMVNATSPYVTVSSQR